MSNLLNYIELLNRVHNINIIDASLRDQGNRMKPCSSSFVEKLEKVVITNEDVDNNLCCAICQDSFKLGEKVIKLPCKDPHYFHYKSDEEECGGILPWLKDNNSCPICREEFPEEDIPVPDENFDQATDDPEVSEDTPEVTEQLIEYIIRRMNSNQYRNTELPPRPMEFRPRPTEVSFQFIQIPPNQIPFNFMTSQTQEENDPDMQEAIRQSLL
jgi:hypothetical protein